MADMYAVKKETLDNIANAIRTKRNITDGISVDDMAMQIGLISGGSDIYMGTITFPTKNRVITLPRINNSQNLLVFRNDYKEFVNMDNPASSTNIVGMLFIKDLSTRISANLTAFGYIRLGVTAGYTGIGVSTAQFGERSVESENEFILDLNHTSYTFDPNIECTYIQW